MEALNPLQKLNKDLKTASKVLSEAEVRFLVDNYYQMQENRKRFDNQVRAIQETNEPSEVIYWLADNAEMLEKQIQKALDIYTRSQPMGVWMRSICGIGPVISAGMLAHIDIRKAPTVGHIYSFGGLNPDAVWNKGEKRPWNARLKVLFWKLGESFVKVSGNKNDIYGQFYLQRKAEETLKNEEGFFKELAAKQLEKFNYGKDTDAYAAYIEGKLPKAHIHARAKRFAVKMFLSHLHEVWYEHHYGVKPARPYAIAILGHAHYMEPPVVEDISEEEGED